MIPTFCRESATDMTLTTPRSGPLDADIIREFVRLSWGFVNVFREVATTICWKRFGPGIGVPGCTYYVVHAEATAKRCHSPGTPLSA
jgi:hypothetical protein